MKKLLLTLSCLVASSVAIAQKSVTVGDHDLSIRFDGRITYDAALYVPQRSIESLRYGSDAFRFSSGANLSQMRLGFHAMLGTKFSGRFDANFSDRRVAMTDAALFWRIDRNSKLIMGYFKDPVSMENNTASRYLSVATPMAVAMLTHGQRYVGVTYAHWGDQYWVAGGAYAGTLGAQTMPRANRGNDGYGVSARAVYLPINNDYTTLHLGLYGRYRVPDEAQGAISIGTLPESTIDSRRFVSASLLGVKHYWLGGVEAALRYDRLYFTGEYLVNSYHFTSGSDPYVAWGWTFTGSYMLRGKQRKYLKSDAVFNPSGYLDHRGGLELIGRLGMVSLNDTDHTRQFGRAFSAMCGLNWYPRANLLFGLNYTYLDHDRYAAAGGQIRFLSHDIEGIDFHTIQLRAQLVF